MTVDTILVDGTDLQSAARIIQVWGGVHAVPDNRGSGFYVPGRDGIVDDLDRPFQAGTLNLGLLLRGGAPDVTGFNDAYRTLVQLVKPGRKVTLTRRLSYSSGNEDHTAEARLISGMSPEMVSPADGRIGLTFLILGGLWLGSPDTFTVASPLDPYTTEGTAPTRSMTITFPGAGTLANATTGSIVTVTAAATIDVANKTSTGSVSDVNAVGDPFGAWFSLEGGYNDLGWSGSGSVSITYDPVHL